MEIDISLKPLILDTIGSFMITNSMVSFVFVILFILGLLGFVAWRQSQSRVPKGLTVLVELYLNMLFDFVDGITGDRKVTTKIYPLFATLVTMLLTANLLGLFPLWGAISYNEMPIWRPPTADFLFVVTIAATMLVTWQLVGLFTAGPIKYIKRYFNWSSPIDFFVGLLDIIGEFAKLMSISFRLFGNIFAGEAIAAVMAAMVPVVVPVPFAFLGLLSSVVQAFVFPMLVLLFMTMSIEPKEEAASEPERSDSGASDSGAIESQKQQDQPTALT